MKIPTSRFYLAAIILTVSCSSGDASPFDSEADILSCTLVGDVLKTDPVIENDRVALMLKAETDITDLSPQFALTPGASIDPPSGTPRDFTFPQTYTVTSANGVWNKTYSVSGTTQGMVREFNFENSELPSGYYVFYEESVGGDKQYIWATGNAGYSLFGGKNADAYPTVHYPDGRTGKAVKLETLATSGIVGTMSGIHLIPGNLYIGSFVSASVILDPLKATRFGLPCEFIPTEVKGYYKYTPGEKFINEKKKPVEGKTDTFSIVAVVYETDAKTTYLNGHDLWTNDNIVATGEIPNDQKHATDQWTTFSFPVTPKPGKTIDQQKLAAGGYNLALVFTSSAEGDKYHGAVGSTLLIDDVRLIRED